MDNLERGGGCMEKLNEIVSAVDGFVWGPVMLVLLVGTGIFLTIRPKRRGRPKFNISFEGFPSVRSFVPLMRAIKFFM